MERAVHEWPSLSHVQCECKYLVVVTRLYRQTVYFELMRRQIGKIPRNRCRHRGNELSEGHSMSDDTDLLLSIPPDYRVAYTMGFLKRNREVRFQRELMNERRVTNLQF